MHTIRGWSLQGNKPSTMAIKWLWHAFLEPVAERCRPLYCYCLLILDEVSELLLKMSAWDEQVKSSIKFFSWLFESIVAWLPQVMMCFVLLKCETGRLWLRWLLKEKRFANLKFSFFDKNNLITYFKRQIDYSSASMMDLLTKTKISFLKFFWSEHMCTLQYFQGKRLNHVKDEILLLWWPGGSHL